MATLPPDCHEIVKEWYRERNKPDVSYPESLIHRNRSKNENHCSVCKDALCRFSANLSGSYVMFWDCGV